MYSVHVYIPYTIIKVMETHVNLAYLEAARVSNN